MIRGQATPAHVLRTIIDSLSNGLQQMIIEKELEQETHKQFREKVLKSSKLKTEVFLSVSQRHRLLIQRRYSDYRRQERLLMQRKLPRGAVPRDEQKRQALKALKSWLLQQKKKELL